MTNNTIEIKVKRRTVEVNLDNVKKLVGRNDITFDEICRIFDEVSCKNYIQNDKKVPTNVKNSVLTTMEQFVASYTTYKNPKNKRQVLYSIEKLHNEDAKPVEREENKGGAPASDLSVYLEALVLISLENKLLPEQDLTNAQWMSHFGLINEKQHDDYNMFKYNNNYENAIHEARRMTDDVVEFLEDDGSIGLRKLKDEHIQITLNQIMYSYDTVSNRLRGALNKLDKKKLIKYHCDYIYGIKFTGNQELADEEKYYEEIRKSYLENLSREELYQISKSENDLKVLLTPAQVTSLDNLKLEVKKELEVMKENGENVHRGTMFKLRKEKLQNDGLADENGNVEFFDFTFKTATINRYFTDRELKKYLDKNVKVKEVYEQGVKEVVEKYNDLRLEHLINWFDDNYFKQIKKIDDVDVSIFLGKARKQKEFEKAKRKLAQDGFSKFGKNLSKEVMNRKYKVLEVI